ncbi:MAG: hypothetical protein ACJ74H_10720 [Thermoanaerobaculia bacterium]
MRVVVFLLVVLSALAENPSRGRGFVLANEALRFDADLRPLFSEQQLRTSSAVTRDGLVKWAATAEGKSIIAHFQVNDREVIVIESAEEPTIGRAPQPGFLTMLAAADAKQLKTYRLIVNPALAAEYHGTKSIDLGLPRTPADAMALAWAGEMLHIEFYAAGIPLPHHQRADFQERWRVVAQALGMWRAEHGG